MSKGQIEKILREVVYSSPKKAQVNGSCNGIQDYVLKALKEMSFEDEPFEDFSIKGINSKWTEEKLYDFFDQIMESQGYKIKGKRLSRRYKGKNHKVYAQITKPEDKDKADFTICGILLDH